MTPRHGLRFRIERRAEHDLNVRAPTIRHPPSFFEGNANERMLGRNFLIPALSFSTWCFEAPSWAVIAVKTRRMKQHHILHRVSTKTRKSPLANVAYMSCLEIKKLTICRRSQGPTNAHRGVELHGLLTGCSSHLACSDHLKL